MKLELKSVEYFGHKITVTPIIEWLATDADGLLYGYEAEPQLKGDHWNEVFYECAVICHVDLQGMDWKDTKVKV